MKHSVFLLYLLLLTLFSYRIESVESIYLDTIDKGEYHSQALQDKMVGVILYGFLEKQDPGYYLEIGAGEPIFNNNSYFFEKNLNWNGVSIDISSDLNGRWYAARKNLFLSENALTCDYRKILQSFPKVIDYLSLDIDGQYDEVLKKIPFGEFVFKVITIEHDFYRFGEIYQREERRILQSLGCQLLCSDVMLQGLRFEDWWVHPSFFSPSQLTAILSLNLHAANCQDVIVALQNALVNR